MNRVCSIFSQILQSISKTAFDRAVVEYKAERHARGFTCWGQFVAMLFCQLGRAQSLGEICHGLAACEGKLRHLGMQKAPPKSTLAYANQHRPWQLYESVFRDLLGRCQRDSRGHKFRFRNKLVSLDSSTIALSLSLYDWAEYSRTKGAVKLHLVLDHDGYLPSFAVITTGKRGDVPVGRALHFEPGTIVVMDRGYADYRWWQQLTKQGVYLVSRLRDDCKYEVLKQRPVPANQAEILCDEEINLTSRYSVGKEGLKLRRIEVRDEATQTILVFVTNHFHLAARSVAAVYRDRWQVETFFKSLKQLLRIKTFVGTSENAVRVQIWTALIAMLLLRWMKLQATYGWSLSHLLALIRQQLFIYRDLWHWLDHPFETPPVLQQPEYEQLQLVLEPAR